MNTAGRVSLAVRGLLVVTAGLAGCLTGPVGTDGVFHSEASNPMIMPPPEFPYDGSGMVAATGSMVVHAIDKDNTGYVDVDLSTDAGLKFRIHWDAFSIQPNQTWQDGGIACNLIEHGASGHGNKMEPQFNLFCGGWGKSNATYNGAPLVDPVTGETSFNVHFMMTKEAMLDEGTNKVYKADKKTPFDPKQPGDGYVFPDRPEGHFAIWGQGAYKDGLAVLKPGPVVTFGNDTATGATYSKSFPIPVTGIMTQIAVDARLNMGSVGQLMLNFKDPTGKVVATGTMNPLQGVRLNAPPGPLTIGNYSLEVTGQGVNAGYVAQVTVMPPTPYLLHVVFTKVKIGE